MADVHVLLVEDSPSDAELVAATFDETGDGAVLTCATTLGRALALLAEAPCDGLFDVALVDLSLPDAQELEVITALRAAAPDLPLVVLTGLADDAVALDALAAGAQDYLGKDGLTPHLLSRTLRYARERARAEAAERSATRWAAALLDGLEAPTCAVDRAGTVVAVNAAMRERAGRLLGCRPGDHLPRAWRHAGPSAGAVLDGLTDVLAGRQGRFDLDLHTADDRWWSVRVTPLPGRTGAVVTQVDVTALQRAHQQLNQAVLHDPLTGLPNRTLLRDRLGQAAALAARQGGVVAVAFLDVDRFKAVNDALGHAVGDRVLVAVAERLAGAARTTDTVARVSGDEFVVAWAADDAAAAAALAGRMVAAVNLPVLVDGRTVPVGVSAGLATGRSEDSVDQLLRAADEAMYAAKERGGGQLHVSSAQLRDRLARRLEVEVDLETALAEDRLEVHYQPVVRLLDGRPTGVEALVRLRSRDGRLLPPSEFIDVAERTGLIVPLGSRVLELACAAAAGWSGERDGLSVAVNLSTRQLAQPDVVATVQRSLARSSLPPSRLVLEVTESAVVEDADAALRALTALKALGVRIAIDDFGTGYSSFLYLKRFPVDVLKIDRSFVAGMLDSPDDAAIVASIVRLGHDVGVTLVAEGVETEAQRERLLRLGCTEAQGYLFSRPVPPQDLPAALAAGHRPVPAPRAPQPDRTSAVPPQVRARMEQLSSQGASLHTIAAKLNAEGERNPDGRRWHSRSVARSLGATERADAGRQG